MAAMRVIQLKKSSKADKKWMAIIPAEGDRTKTVHFGQSGASDFTMHGDAARRDRYIHRHRGMGEDWGPSGYKTPGFYSRWITWSKPTISGGIAEANKRLPAGFRIKKYV